jgi:hypothetical protein
VAETVYVVVVVGETVTEAPLKLPGFHTYVYPGLELDAVNVALCPVQMVAFVDEVAFTEGEGVTVAITGTRDPSQPVTTCQS